MNLLGIDTSFLSDTTLGYYFSEKEQLEIHFRAPLSQEEKLLSAIDSGFRVLGRNIGDIDWIAVGVGPGSFTGLRIGIAAARSLAWTLKKKLMGLSSLELYAESVPAQLVREGTLLVPLIDARMNRVFTALFQDGKNLTGNLDISPDELAEIIGKADADRVIFFGDGLDRYGGLMENRLKQKCVFLKDLAISGGALCRKALKRLAENPDDPGEIDPVLPEYIRISEAEAQLRMRQQ